MTGLSHTLDSYAEMRERRVGDTLQEPQAMEPRPRQESLEDVWRGYFPWRVRSRVGVAEGVWREVCVCVCVRGCVRVLLLCVRLCA